jgi:opacity protein-like surface antigen
LAHHALRQISAPIVAMLLRILAQPWHGFLNSMQCLGVLAASSNPHSIPGACRERCEIRQAFCGGVLASSNYIEAPSGAFGPAFGPEITAVGTSSAAPRGVIGGIEAGYNWQAGMFVLGFETDFSGWDLSASSGVSSFGPTTLSATSSINSNWLFTARPRIGFANGNMLTYLTGGLAVSNISLAQSMLLSGAGPTLAGSASSTQLGWTAGGGVEYALSWNWFIKAE